MGGSQIAHRSPRDVRDGRWSLVIEGVRATRAAGASASHGDAASRPARRSLLLPGFRRQTRLPAPKTICRRQACACGQLPRSASIIGWPLNAARACQPVDRGMRCGHALATGMRVKATMPLLHHRGHIVMGHLNVTRYGKRVERVHGPGAVEQVPIFITGGRSLSQGTASI
jgi:hypothetical protein